VQHDPFHPRHTARKRTVFSPEDGSRRGVLEVSSPVDEFPDFGTKNAWHRGCSTVGMLRRPPVTLSSCLVARSSEASRMGMRARMCSGLLSWLGIVLTTACASGRIDSESPFRSFQDSTGHGAFRPFGEVRGERAHDVPKITLLERGLRGGCRTVAHREFGCCRTSDRGAAVRAGCAARRGCSTRLAGECEGRVRYGRDGRALAQSHGEFVRSFTSASCHLHRASGGASAPRERRTSALTKLERRPAASPGLADETPF
jgi:hypothetical protein